MCHQWKFGLLCTYGLEGVSVSRTSQAQQDMVFHAGNC